jgi:hypothetical protein
MEALKEKCVLDRETQNKENFIMFILVKFARAYKMSFPDVYLYLKKYGGMDYLNECWWALHTDNPIYAVRDMFIVCRNNGGMR